MNRRWLVEQFRRESREPLEEYARKLDADFEAAKREHLEAARRAEEELPRTVVGLLRGLAAELGVTDSLNGGSSGRIKVLEEAITAHLSAWELSQRETLSPAQELVVAEMVVSTRRRLRALVGLEVES